MSNSFKIEGKFLGAGKVVEVGEKLTKVRKFWIDITDNVAFPNTPEFQLLNDKCMDVEGLKAGDKVEITFNISGRKWEKDDKRGVGINLQAYKIVKFTRENSATQVPAELMAPNGQDDDLPF